MRNKIFPVRVSQSMRKVWARNTPVPETALNGNRCIASNVRRTFDTRTLRTIQLRECLETRITNAILRFKATGVRTHTGAIFHFIRLQISVTILALVPS